MKNKSFKEIRCLIEVLMLVNSVLQGELVVFTYRTRPSLWVVD